MSFKKFIISSAAVLLLAGCAHTSPIAIIIPSNPVLRGTQTFEPFSPSNFSATNGNLTCYGNDKLQDNTPVVCNDGRKGVAFLPYEGRDTTANHGTITFNDGTKADFVTDDAVNAY